MSVALELLASSANKIKWTAVKDELTKLLRNQLVIFSKATPSIGTLLLTVVTFYLVFSRLGPVITRVGDSSFEAFDICREFGVESDHASWQNCRLTFHWLKEAIRVPAPLIRRSSRSFQMGASSSKADTRPSDKSPSPAAAGGDVTVAKVTQSEESAFEEKEEESKAAEVGVGDTGPPPRKPSQTSTESSSQSNKKRKGSSDTVDFSQLEDSLETGDLAVMRRQGQNMPHFAIFIQHEKCDPKFPLLLVKGRTRPIKMEDFDPAKPRNVHTVSAVTRIFYGDYETVAVRHLEGGEPLSCAKAMDMIDDVQMILYSKAELDAIDDAENDADRSAIVGAFMVAHFYKKLGVFTGDPRSVTPLNLQDQLHLSKPTFVNLPPVKEGPVVKGDPPFLAKLVDGIFPLPDVSTKPLKTIIQDGLQTGDLVLFSGATSSGAIIKFFDHSTYSHVAVVLKAKYTQQLLVFEASTNRAGLVDIQSGKVLKGVEVLPLRQKIFSGWYNLVAVRRLTGIDQEQREEMYAKLLEFREEVQGRPYEKDKLELILSSIDFQEDYLSFLRNTHEDLSSLFCSELVAAAYKRMGLLKTKKLSNEFTPDDFSNNGDLELNFGQLEPEVYVELKFDMAGGPDSLGRQVSTY